MTTTAKGIIPALAGNTDHLLHVARREGDHPRACGEHPVGGSASWLSRGSSPRLRGTHLRRDPDRAPEGIIPALAGNTPYRSSRRAPMRDHPRACGEHTMWSAFENAQLGSSPRLRGTPVSISLMRPPPGIIPALAGNTPPSRTAWSRPWDHPRACGEHHKGAGSIRRRLGSSPRLRGTHGSRPHAPRGIGIIPALAGNTIIKASFHSTVRDHPRACGEHRPYWPRPLWRCGSSPRLRGTLVCIQKPHCAAGIIPALAGNTSSRKSRSGWMRDHPRACGEHDMFGDMNNTFMGSSPRLRGTLGLCYGGWARTGIIPALAGNTL